MNQARDVVNQHYENQDCKTYADFQELLARPDIDAVTVCTPDHWHGLITVAAARAGKDIYCEKPLTNSIPEGRAVADAVRDYGRVLQTGSHERSGSNARYACELVRNGYIGHLHTIEIHLPNSDGHHLAIMNDTNSHEIVSPPQGLDYDKWLGPAPWAPYTPMRTHFWWRFIMNYGGGEMTDRGAHIIDLAQLGNGTDDTGPVELSARGKRCNSALFDAFMQYEFECRYANGVRMVGSSNPPRGLRFIGDEGSIFIHIHGAHLEAEPASLLQVQLRTTDVSLGRSPGHHQDFLNAMRTRKQPVAPAEAGHRTASICHLLNLSMALERDLRWNPETEELDDSQAQRLVTRTMRSPWRL
jgi:predicted dehydrogenase